MKLILKLTEAQVETLKTLVANTDLTGAVKQAVIEATVRDFTKAKNNERAARKAAHTIVGG